MRASGILLPISSIPSPHGIGCFDRNAYRFVDTLVSCGQKYWQILPMGPTGYGDSPYQSFSTFAGNPYYISLDALAEEGLLTAEEIAAADLEDEGNYVNYEKQYNQRFPLLRKAFDRSNIAENEEFQAFVLEQQEWLPDYCLFMAIKDTRKGAGFLTWEEELKRRDEAAIARCRETYKNEISFYMFLQYEFDKQWKQLKKYANDKGVQIIGDIPIYVALDSADTWAHPELFQFTEDLEPIAVAGCPPDAFSNDGQKWGNPIYDWERMEKEGFSWWRRRMDAAGRLFDIIRLDHFIGFARYYSIPAEDENGRNGKWNKGPGRKLTEAIEETLGKNRVIAEDLGVLVPAVKKLLKKTGWPGMRVLLFAFDGNPHNEHLPYNYESQNEVVYTGTHDNETVAGYFAQKTQKELEFAYRYLEIHERRQIPDALIREAYRSSADIVIISLQDLLGLSNEARMNFPSTIGKNWRFRMKNMYMRL